MGTPPPKPNGRAVAWFATQIGDPVLRLRFLKIAAPSPPKRPRRVSRIVVLALLALTLAASFLLIRAAHSEPPPLPAMARPVPRAPAVPSPRPPEVWLVEQSGGQESYSNGLRIDTRLTVANHPRAYLAWPLRPGGHAERRSRPIGILFHATESRQAPFEARENGTLRRIAESLLEYVQRRRAYHFVIDRFGGVHRIVREEDAANHAGFSAWADDQWLYLNLNESFLGIAFEAESEASPAQIRAAGMLIEMLRSKYGLTAANCVTHAQVSLSPANMRIGYHVDWAMGFPFERVGLPNNYAEPPPAIWALGCAADPAYLAATARGALPGVESAERLLEQNAASARVPVRLYRQKLQRAYRQKLEESRFSVIR